MYRIKILVLMMFFLGLLPFSCGNVKQPYYQIDKIMIYAFKDRALTEQVFQSDSLNQDTTFIKLEFEGQNIAFNAMCIHFDNPVYALKKAYNGYRGLKNKVSSILLYSNKPFNGRSPGSSLNELFYTRGSVEDWVKSMNNAPGLYFQTNSTISNTIILTQRPMDALSHTLTMEMTFEDGVKKTAVSRLNWRATP